MVRKCGYCKKVIPDDSDLGYCSEEHRELRLQKNREYYAKKKELCRESSAKWKRENAEKVNEYNRKYYRENKETMQERDKARLEYKREWRKKRKENVSFESNSDL